MNSLRSLVWLIPFLTSASALAQPEPRILSAFFGADERDVAAVAECGVGPVTDGLVLVLSHEIDAGTLDAEAFVVEHVDGSTATPDCATVVPAHEEDEDRTILLVGQLGGRGALAPRRVLVADGLDTDDGTPFGQMQSPPVVPLAAGPSMAHAKVVAGPFIDQDDTWSTVCPPETLQLVKVSWEGGISARLGRELEDAQRLAHTVLIESPSGAVVAVTPFALADLGDGDNVVDLCLDVEGTPIEVHVPARTVQDPIGDMNPETTVIVTP